MGQLKERLARFPGMADFLELLEGNRDLIGENPYRYAHVDKDGARGLARLIRKQSLTRKIHTAKPLTRKIFAAHSECDATASIDGIETIRKLTAPCLFTFFRLRKTEKVPHASVVLSAPVLGTGGRVLEEANPRFPQMMAAITSGVVTKPADACGSLAVCDSSTTSRCRHFEPFCAYSSASR